MVKNYLVAFFGSTLVLSLVVSANTFFFDGRWHNIDHSSWVIVVGLVSGIAFFVGWAMLAPFFGELVTQASSRWGFVDFMLRCAVAVMTSAFVFRLIAPKPSEWFGDLGDFLNPPLAAVSLAALAFALKISSDQVKEQELSRKLAGSSWIVVEEVRAVSDDIIISLSCIGDGPALNASVRFTRIEPSGIGLNLLDAFVSLDLATLAAGKSSQQVVRGSGPLQESFWVQVQWQSSQLLEFSYVTHLSQRQSGVWLPASAVLPVRGAFFRESLLAIDKKL